MRLRKAHQNLKRQQWQAMRLRLLVALNRWEVRKSAPDNVVRWVREGGAMTEQLDIGATSCTKCGKLPEAEMCPGGWYVGCGCGLGVGGWGTLEGAVAAWNNNFGTVEGQP